MIHTNRTVTVGNQESTIDGPIILYRGDKEIEVEFSIVGNKFTFKNKGNVIESSNASSGQLVILTPYGGRLFSDKSECRDGKVSFTITRDMTDELREVGLYSMQIRLYDDSLNSRITLPVIPNGIEIREPIAAEEGSSVADDAIVDTSTVVDGYDLAPFIGDRYNKTRWMTNDAITSGKLNKIENAIDVINTNTNNNTYYVNKVTDTADNNRTRIQNVESDIRVIDLRVSNLTSLQEGSTTGDAELVDGRIGYDGNTYICVGDSIRYQMADVYKVIDSLTEIKVKYDYEWIEGGYVHADTGDVVLYNDWKYTDFIEIDEGVTALHFKTNSDSSLGYNAFYDSEKIFIKNINANGGDTNIPYNARYFRLSVQSSRNISVFNVIKSTLDDKCDIEDVDNAIKNNEEELINEYIGLKRDAYEYEWIDGGYIDVNNNGVVADDTTWKYTDFVQISEGARYLEVSTTLNDGIIWNAFYDADKNYIINFNVMQSLIEVPNNAVYFRLSCYYDRNTDILNHITPLNDRITREEANDISETASEDMAAKYIGLNENAYDIKWNNGGYVSDVDGGIIVFSEWKYSDYTPISEKAEYLVPSTTLGGSYGFNAFYDINKNCIKIFSVNNEKINIPKDAKYFRISTPISQTTTIKNYIIPVLDVIDDRMENHKKMYIGETYETKWNRGGYIDHLTGEVMTFSGWKYTDFITIDSDVEYILMNSTLKNNDNYNAFYDTDKNFIRYIQANRGEIKVPNNAVYVRMSTREVENTEIIKVEKYNDRNNIVSLNKDIEPLIIQSHHGLGKPFGDTNKPLTFVHFTDIHAHSTLWNRMVEYVNYYEDYIDFSIHTGDYVNSNRVTAYYDLYNKGVQCVKPIYNVVGNHDTYLEDFSRGDKATTKNLVFNWSNTWDVTFMDIEDSMTYYKDYPESKIRMIVLDYYYDIDEQCAWLTNLLNDASNLGYHVVTFTHEVTHPIVNKLDTPFQTIDDYESLGGNIHSLSKFDKVIGDWIKNGGIHIANFVGHEHSDFIGYTENGVLNMCAQAATDHIYWTDANRVPGTKTHDCFNVVSVDTSTGMFKAVRVGNNYDHYLREKKSLVYDYINKKLLDR